MHAELLLEVPVEHGLLLENLLDLAHAPFTHTSTFAKGWPVPEAVRFNAARLLGGSWEPYPIDMSFEPPCMVLSTIGAGRLTGQGSSEPHPIDIEPPCLVLSTISSATLERMSLRSRHSCLLCLHSSGYDLLFVLVNRVI